jgi:2-methylisocitrate lyase-like PEP mutase family enzyme
MWPLAIPMTKPTRQLRKLLSTPGLIRSLGAHDVFTALIIERAGFETVFIGGFGASASMLGPPDLNFLTMTEMADAVRRMASRLRIPIIADGDTGHGDVHNIQRTVRTFERAGAAGILLEDQVAPKRCGHFEGKQVIPAEEMLPKLKVALEAREDSDFIIIARTDAREEHGLQEAIDRANRYGDAGADVVFIEAPHSEAELAEIPQTVRYPLLVNMLTGGKTPILPMDRLAEMGYKIAVCPIESLLVTAHAVQRLAVTLKETGRVDQVEGMVSFGDVKELLGVEEFLRLPGKP